MVARTFAIESRPIASAEGMSQIDLEAAVRSGDEDRILGVLDAIGRGSASGAELDQVRELAKKTRSPVVRNAAAIALADLNAGGAHELLISLIKRTETRGANGTLLYALREMNAYVPLPVLIDIITDDRTYEALEGALDLIASNAERYKEGEKTEAVSRLKPLLTSTDAHTSRSAELAIKYLTRKPKPCRR
jgi:HEAT repeat protein